MARLVETPVMTTPREPAASARRAAPVAMSRETFQRLGHRLVDRIAHALEQQPRGPVTHDDGPEEIRRALGLGGPLPEDGTAAERLLEDTARLLFEHSLVNGHPRFFGYITGSPAPIGMLGDLLAAAVNPNVGAWILSPAATEIETETVRWIAEFLGFPSTAGGLLVSGGNMANLVALVAARRARLGEAVRTSGVDPTRHGHPRVYASAEAHTWVQKACDMNGLGTDAIRWIPTDWRQRMDVAALTAAVDRDVANGDAPVMVVGTAGSVATGAVDPLPAIAAVCRARGVWFHVDGAYGGVAAQVPGAPADLAGLVEADSVAVDPHKWLYAPLEAGCVLVRDAEALRAAFAYHPPYYRFGEHAIDFLELGPQNSRGFRALKVWLALKQAGASGYRQMIGEDMRLSRLLAAAVAAHPDLELGTQQLSITTFRYVPDELRDEAPGEARDRALDTLNRAILDRLQRGGETFVSHAVVAGRTLLRACIVNFHTTEADLDALVAIVARVGREIEAELRARPEPPTP